MSVSFDVHVTLTEPEARALLALTAYGTDDFLKFFYQHMGQSCLGPHEAGLRTLFETSKLVISPLLKQVSAGRDAMQAAQSESKAE
jgi:hypothetical protein